MDQKYLSLAAVLAYSRNWHGREQNRYPLHPAVLCALEKGWVPSDWHQLILEWPHESTKKPGMLSYTLNEAKGIADRQEPSMKPGRYLRRHFKRASDDEIRDLVSNLGTHIKILYDADEIVQAVMDGPHSCMKWGRRDSDNHPYQVYDPDLGWGLAVMYDDGEYVGRALVLERLGQKGFVRTFGPSRSCSQTHDGMQALLEEMGYEHWDGWPTGTPLALIGSRDNPLLPYLDGENDKVYVDYSRRQVIIQDEGAEFECTNTDGTGDTIDEYTCEDCDDSFRSLDNLTDVAGPDDFHYVCDCCLDNYARVRGVRYGNDCREYYVPNEDAVYADDEPIDRWHLPRGFVTLENGEIANSAYAVCIDGDLYREDDDRIQILHDGEAAMAGDCVELCRISDYSGYALEDDCVETADGWILSSEAEDLDLSLGRWNYAHRDFVTDIEIDGNVYAVHGDEDEDELRHKVTHPQDTHTFALFSCDEIATSEVTA